jgi:integrase/recombinase XerD
MKIREWFFMLLMRIRAFLNYMVECEVIKNNPAKKVKMQKDDVKIEVFSDEQIRQILNFYRRIKQRDKIYVAYRDYLIIVIILGTGIRLIEIINLKWTDIDFVNKFRHLPKISKKGGINYAIMLFKEFIGRSRSSYARFNF